MLPSANLVLLLALFQRAIAQSNHSNVSALSDPGSDQLWTASSLDVTPEPVRGTRGTPLLNASEFHNLPLELQNADTIAGPLTDRGRVPNLKTSWSLIKTSLLTGGWTRTSNVYELGAADEISSSAVGFKPGGVRELHWHDAVEFGYVLRGTCRITCVTPEGQVYVADVPPGDLWNFPHGWPHSIQSLGGPAEVIVTFDKGDVSADTGFTLIDWLARTPKAVVAKNFGFPDLTLVNQIPQDVLSVFNATIPPPLNEDLVIPNNAPNPFTFPFSQVQPIQGPGGSVRIVDSNIFKVATAISALEATVNVGGMRELHYHPNTPTWINFITGQARMTVYAPGGAKARTFDFQAGDIGYLPSSYGHYVLNTGNATLKFVEFTKSALYQDISALQWLALVPYSLSFSHFGWPANAVKKFPRTKQYIV